MHKYKIATDVNLDKYKSINQDVWNIFKIITEIFGVTNSKKEYTEKIKESEIILINTVDELNKYTNCLNMVWNYQDIYIEHPLRKNWLIPVNSYKDYILREIVSDISNYILDHISVAEFTFGVITSFNSGLGASISIKKINADAKVDCKIAQSYYHHITNTIRKISKNKYLWIDQFPEIKSAVEHDADSMENITESAFDFSGDADLAKILKGSFKANKKMQFYISYKKR